MEIHEVQGARRGVLCCPWGDQSVFLVAVLVRGVLQSVVGAHPAAGCAADVTVWECSATQSRMNCFEIRPKLDK